MALQRCERKTFHRDTMAYNALLAAGSTWLQIRDVGPLSASKKIVGLT